eukprot:CAMPEP_0194295244 /NCGR_PEP_ID=MMETSP0169-20130528/52967_1 /TAXON_ID=218684 /ORGANISM="Corethron pennatum, Strain L29A3" /LENGTH=635 /DNA_ID=CAMNT_0039044367 /DNA_START=19 /DNA_END=1926 /DNA_ORIENTATION=+
MTFTSAAAKATVIITGGGGFLGQCLARRILEVGTVKDSSGKLCAVTRLILADIGFPPLGGALASTIVESCKGSVADGAFIKKLFERASEAGGAVSIFHLGAVMSGTGEADFDLCIDSNLRGTMNMLEGARNLGAAGGGCSCPPKFIFTSAGAIIGSGHKADYTQKDDTVSDSCRAAPHTTYGMTKACCELLLSDYSRRGFLDGRAVRLPTVAVRAGAPNAATTSCFSAVVREPLGGSPVTLPIGPDVAHAVTSVRAAVGAMLVLHDAEKGLVEEVLGFDRTVFLPARALSMRNLEEGLLKIVTPDAHRYLGKISYEVDEKLSAVVASFPTKIDAARAKALGVPDAPDAETIVREYAADFPSALHAEIKIVPRKETRPVRAAVTERVAVITGGGSGIGRAVALRLAEGGFSLVLAGRRRTALEETRAMLPPKHPCICVSTDVTSEHDVDGLFAAAEEAYGRVDLLFNNAGINIPPANVWDVAPSDFKKVLNTNVTGPLLCARAAMRSMARNPVPGGRIINNGSISAHVPRPMSAAYTVSKHAVSGLTKCIALDGRSSGVNVACGQVDFGNVVSELMMNTNVPGAGALQPNGQKLQEPSMTLGHAAETVWTMAQLPLEANILNMTVMATGMPYVGRG